MKVKKMFQGSFDVGLSGIPPPALVPELLACRACLATDTKLYKLSGALKETYEYLVGTPLNTNFVRSVDRVSHKLLLKFTLGIENKVVHMIHDDKTGDTKISHAIDKCIQCNEKTYTETDALTDVLNDFEEITRNLNDDIDLSDEFNDINGSTFIDRAKNFSDDVEELFREGINNHLNDSSGKSISITNDIGDAISRAFKGKGKGTVKKSIGNENNIVAVKKSMNEDTSSSFRDAEEVINGNLSDNQTFIDVSVNTNDLNDTDSNLVETFNNFILDHDYLDEKFLLETGDTEFMRKNVISKKTDEESLLREIIPKMNNKDKNQLLREIKTIGKPNKMIKPVKNLSKLKEINRQQKIRTDEIIKEFKAKQLKDNADDNPKPIATKPELPADDKVKTELSKDFIKFGTDFKFRIFELTKEEQLEELQRKREGVLYLGAPYKCVDCAKGFHSLATFGNHMRVHAPSYGPFACAVCGARHATQPRRRRHADAHRLKFCCTQCEFVARSREKAESHYEWHAGKTFACQYCGEQFGAASTHLSHVRLRHAGACERCARCGAACVGARGLRLHARRRHPARHQRDECSTSVQPRTTRAHPAPPPAAAPPPAPPLAPPPAPAAPRPPRARAKDKKAMCELCGNKYHSAAALAYHQRAHSGERPYACARCPKAFALNHSLQAHMRTHTGERPFRCSQCARAFPNANNLARHNKTVHLGQRPYARCAVCRKWLSSPSAARLHAASVHAGRPWPRKPRG